MRRGFSLKVGRGDRYIRRGLRLSASGTRLLEEQGEYDGRRDTIKKRLKGHLVMLERPLAATARTHQQGAEYRAKKRGKGETDKVDHAGGGAAMFGAVGLFDNRIGEHRGARCDPGDQAQTERRKKICGSVQYED